jgi:type I restriction enzyme, S subunit
MTVTATTEGWKQVRLGEAFKITSKPRDLRIDEYEAIPFVPMDFVPQGTLYFSRYQLRKPNELGSGTYFEAGDALIPKITPSFENGKQGVIHDLPIPFGYATTEVVPFRGTDDVSDTLFLFFYLLRSSVRADMASKMEGSTGRQRLSKQTFLNLTMPLPPLQEQRAIVKVLRMVQAAGDARCRELDLERERKSTLMEYLFNYGTRGEQRIETELGLLPKSWRIISLANGAEFFQYGTSKKCIDHRIGSPVLRIPNIVSGAIDTVDLKYLAEPDGEAESLKLKTGDLLFVRTNGQQKYIGRCAMYCGKPDNCLFASYLIRARVKSLLSPGFVQMYTTTGTGRSFLAGRASNAADGKFNINTQTLRQVVLPVPELEEQHAIERAIDACSAKIAGIEQELYMIAELFQSLLEDLMSGRLSSAPLVAESNL